jgi:hypothetical protein
MCCSAGAIAIEYAFKVHVDGPARGHEFLPIVFARLIDRVGAGLVRQ